MVLKAAQGARLQGHHRSEDIDQHLETLEYSSDATLSAPSGQQVATEPPEPPEEDAILQVPPGEGDQEEYGEESGPAADGNSATNMPGGEAAYY